MSLAALSSAFAPNSIAVGVVVDSREAAIVGAGELLVASGRTTAGYTAEMLAVLNELGPYFVIAPGIAIAHARPSESVLSAGLSLAVLAMPVEFGSDHTGAAAVHALIDARQIGPPSERQKLGGARPVGGVAVQRVREHVHGRARRQRGVATLRPAGARAQADRGRQSGRPC